MPETIAKALTLEQFLQQPETKPALEYIHGQILTKIMPQGKHSAIQTLLAALINSVLKISQSAWAFTELRCTFSDKSLIPDIAVFRWEQIPCDATGEVADIFLLAPAWTIEILSPGQSLVRVTKNILYCLAGGTEMGWLIYPEDRSVFVYCLGQTPRVFGEDDQMLLVPEFAQNLEIKTHDIFACLIKQ
ncbi:Uncharacterized protein conserved in cyanobacteria [Gloeomargarita lithophora Alchichica-D10]|uniref:Uncharacterized protein conserved in cyanobacteria n=1 Tax=Gloeomargarita lithophora Alchichica-D10 TaxID=1188229 RepID=A0A1J0AEN6_9CYAN|nr:Uma2 family endonuclease [Gloeomargarita lithophora]APB34376.1 Uncharacterized protein conserved in cyanobacteria [Gloeomargarita lithophora Alchichica-D10]